MIIKPQVKNITQLDRKNTFSLLFFVFFNFLTFFTVVLYQNNSPVCFIRFYFTSLLSVFFSLLYSRVFCSFLKFSFFTSHYFLLLWSLLFSGLSASFPSLSFTIFASGLFSFCVFQNLCFLLPKIYVLLVSHPVDFSLPFSSYASHPLDKFSFSPLLMCIFSLTLNCINIFFSFIFTFS
jgi:hypothetical protein